MRYFAVSVLFALVGCKAATPTPQPTPTPAPTPVVCSEVALASCGTTPGCATIDGFYVGDLDAEPICLDPTEASQAIGCHDADTPCPAVEVAASDSADRVFLIPGGCTPLGWTVQSFTVDECATGCAALGLADCTTVDGCALIEGRELVAESMSGGECYNPAAPLEPLACVEEQACDDVITYGTEGLDTPVYWFADACLPPGWTDLQESFSECDCTLLPLEDCAANTTCMLVQGRALGTDSTGDCVDPALPLEDISCEPTGACGDMISYAEDPISSLPFEFLDTCTPTGWTVLPGPYETCVP